MKRTALTLLFFILVPVFLLADPVVKTITYEGKSREYLLYVPETPSSRLNGIIVALHGFNRTMEDFFNAYDISQVADELNYLIIAPQALPEQEPDVIKLAETIKSLSGYEIPLEAAWGCGAGVTMKYSILGIPISLSAELNQHVDDSGFIRAAILNTKESYKLATDDIFLFGTSLGGYMSYQYALNYGNELNGLISVAGSMGLKIKHTENPVKLPICDFHSTTDEVVPYTGATTMTGINVQLAQPKADVLSFWAEKNGITSSPVVQKIAYYPSSNGVTAEKITYPDAVNEIIHYRTTNADHAYYFRKENGDCMDMAEEIIRFIRSHQSSTSGIETPESALHFYPNPVRDVIYLNEADALVRIYSMDGQLLFTQPASSGSVNVASLPSGMYILQLESGNRPAYISKLIKL